MIRLCRIPLSHYFRQPRVCVRTASSVVSEERIKKCYHILNIPVNSNQETVRRSFIELAKKYHPDSGSELASIDKFCEIEDAFRILTNKNTGSTAGVDSIEYDIRHKAPQHRQYLSFEGVGHGTPMQREKQYIQAKAQKAAENVMQHRISRAMASENTVMKKDDIKNKHDIKTQYGFERLVEDLIQEAMSKGEFDNLSGKGKPLKGQNYNPFVDFTTHKINEVLINNGFTPEWIMLNKDINEEIAWLKLQLRKERASLGPIPLSSQEHDKWTRICQEFEEYAKKINSKILSFNLVVPIMNKQKFLLKFDEITDDILKNGKFYEKVKSLPEVKKTTVTEDVSQKKDIFVELLGGIFYILSFIYRAIKSKLVK